MEKLLPFHIKRYVTVYNLRKEYPIFCIYTLCCLLLEAGGHTEVRFSILSEFGNISICGIKFIVYDSIIKKLWKHSSICETYLSIEWSFVMIRAIFFGKFSFHQMQFLLCVVLSQIVLFLKF